jgi:hypothetical protein
MLTLPTRAKKEGRALSLRAPFFFGHRLGQHVPKPVLQAAAVLLDSMCAANVA